jgi:hypothetical protein
MGAECGSLEGGAQLPLAGSRAHNRQPLSRQEEDRKTASFFQDVCQEAADRLTASSSNAEFCALMQPLVQNFVREVKAAEVRCAGAGVPETVGPSLAVVESTRGNSLKRKLAGIEGERKHRKPGGRVFLVKRATL